MLKLAPGTIVGLDTSIFIYHFEAHPDYGPRTGELLHGIEVGRWQAVTSVVTLMEIAVQPLKLGRRDIAAQYETLLVNFPHLKIVEIDRDIARQAAYLRSEYRIRPADALQAAACRQHGCQVFVTNDHLLSRLQPLFDIRLLDEWLTT